MRAAAPVKVCWAWIGVNPWLLQAWMGHKRIDETMIYVHVAGAHRRELPEVVRIAGEGVTDPEVRILRMLSARGSYVAAEEASENKKAAISAA